MCLRCLRASAYLASSYISIVTQCRTTLAFICFILPGRSGQPPCSKRPPTFRLPSPKLKNYCAYDDSFLEQTDQQKQEIDTINKIITTKNTHTHDYDFCNGRARHVGDQFVSAFVLLLRIFSDLAI